MQSILVVGPSEIAKGKALEIIKENNISKFDIDRILLEKSVGINDIRLLQKRIFLKPIKSEKKVVILEAFLGMTLESQNAFLKLLEEPPSSTTIIVLVNSIDFLLPTIISRCNILVLEKKEKLDKDTTQNYLKILSQIQNKKSLLKLAQDYGKSREEALNFLENLMELAEKNLQNDNSLAPLLKDMQKTHTIIKTSNVSPRFALENLFLSF